MSRFSDLLRKLEAMEEKQAKADTIARGVSMTDEEIVAVLVDEKSPLPYTGLVELLLARGNRPFMLNSVMFRDRDEMDLISGDIAECGPDDMVTSPYLIVRDDGTPIWKGDEPSGQIDRIPLPKPRLQCPELPREDTNTPPPSENPARIAIQPSLKTIDESDPPARPIHDDPECVSGGFRDLNSDSEARRAYLSTHGSREEWEGHFGY